MLISFIVGSCDFPKKPLDYYNATVGAGNTSLIVCQQLESKIQRLSKGYKDNEDPGVIYKNQLPYWESQLVKLNDLKGNPESDNLIQTGVDFLQFAIDASTSKKMTELLAVVNKDKTAQEIMEDLKVRRFNVFIDSLYAAEHKLYTAYDKTLEEYTQKHGLEYKKLR